MALKKPRLDPSVGKVWEVAPLEGKPTSNLPWWWCWRAEGFCWH